MPPHKPRRRSAPVVETPLEARPGETVIWTDGACSGNPGPGGWAAIIVLPDGEELERSGGDRDTTNNRMELTAVIRALESLKVRCAVTLYTDSRYVADAIEKGWAKKWRANGWQRTTKEKALNPDLWERLLDLLEKHDVRVVWVRGHAGNPENERCDQLSVAAAHQPSLPPDEVYELGKPKPGPSHNRMT